MKLIEGQITVLLHERSATLAKYEMHEDFRFVSRLPIRDQDSGRLIGYLCAAMLAGVGSMPSRVRVSSARANTVLPSAQEENSRVDGSNFFQAFHQARRGEDLQVRAVSEGT